MFGVDYLLSWLGDTFGSLPIGPSGQVFMTDDADMLIATSSVSPSFKMVDGKSQLISAKESDNVLIEALLVLSQDEYKNDLSGFTVGGKKYYVRLSHFQEYGNDWTIYVISAEDDFLGGVKKAASKTMAVILVSILFSIFFTSRTAGWVTKPILSLNNAAKELMRGNLMPITDVEREDGLGELNRSFSEMGRQLINVVAHLEEEVAIRTQELKERNEELKQLSFSDGLTGIANRRLFDDTITSAWNSALRDKRPMAIFMLDIDLFKNYNDTYGHQAGDDRLKAIGSLLNNKVHRSTDLVARYGGEEFVILLENAEIDKISDFAEEIREGIQGLDIEHSTSPYKKVTVSIGCAHMIPTMETTPAMLIEKADRALYQAKENGRNNIFMQI